MFNQEENSIKKIQNCKLHKAKFNILKFLPNKFQYSLKFQFGNRQNHNNENIF